MSDKSELLQSKTTVLYLNIKKQTEEMIKSGTFSFEKIASMNKKLADELESELDKMAFDKVLEADKKKQE